MGFLRIFDLEMWHTVPRFFFQPIGRTKESQCFKELEAEKIKMKYGKLCVAFVIVILCAINSFAQTATLNDCYAMHREHDMEGKKEGIRFFLDIDVNGMKDKKVWCIIEMAYYEEDDSFFFTHSDGKYGHDGHLAVWKQLTPPYESTNYSDLRLFLPYEEIKNSIGNKRWEKGITYCVKIVDANGKVLLKEWQTSKRMEYSQIIFHSTECYSCKGTGICTHCHGKGETYIINSYWPCSFCHGDGRCSRCFGTGRIKISSDKMSSRDVGYGNSSVGSSSYHYDNPSSSNVGGYTPTESSSKNTCAVCNGTGKCTSCAGRGYKEDTYISGGGTHQCGSCNGRGICTTCNGRGYYYY